MAFYGRKKRKYRKIKKNLKRGTYTGKKASRKAKKMAKIMSAAAWRMPSKSYQPPQAFARIRTTFKQSYNNAGASNIVADFILKGNSLNNTGMTADVLGAPIWQFAQLYNRYYIWKSKVQVAYADQSTEANDLGNMRTFCVWPSTTQNAIVNYTQINYDGGSGSYTSPEEIPHVKYLRYTPKAMQQTTGPVNLKNQAKTKKLWAYKTEVEKDFTATIEASGSTTSPNVDASDPLLLWYWHFTAIDVNGAISPGNLKAFICVTVTYFIRFWQPQDFLRKVPES